MPDKSIKETIAKNLLAYRKKSGLTQKQLADMLGVGNSAISNWETGVNSIDIDTLVAACDIFGTTINDMYEAQSDTSVTTLEFLVIKKYRTLDRYGKHNVDTLLNNEYMRCQEQNPSASYAVHTLAAHARPDATEEDKQHDYDMMKDPKYWRKDE